MALVIPFQPRSAPRPEVITFYERMLERAKRGEVQGVVCFLAIATAADEMFVCGEFADNLVHATSAVRTGLECLSGASASQQGDMSVASRRERQKVN